MYKTLRRFEGLKAA